MVCFVVHTSNPKFRGTGHGSANYRQSEFFCYFLHLYMVAPMAFTYGYENLLFNCWRCMRCETCSDFTDLDTNILGSWPQPVFEKQTVIDESNNPFQRLSNYRTDGPLRTHRTMYAKYTSEKVRACLPHE
jgi:hypothetical protein